MLKLLLNITLCFFLVGISAQSDSLVKDTLPPEPDLSFVDGYDSLLVAHYRAISQFSFDTNELNIYNFPEDSVPKYDDEVFEARVKAMDEQTPFNFKFNKSTLAMIKLYAYKRKRLTSRMLAYGELYFPIFEEYLIKYDLPLELKYLPIVESALNPTAKSHAGAGGLWQFMPKTGQGYGLEITSYYDERFDPYLATDAACRYLKKLHAIYGDWSLALAAYNAGPGNVNRAIRRMGGQVDYWAIRSALPKETQNYVPAFIAANYIMNYASEHNLYPNKPRYMNFEIDTIHVCERVEFEVLEEWLGYNIGNLKYLNPMFTGSVIPKPDSVNVLYLPRYLMGDFFMSEDSIYKYSSLEYKYLVAANKPKKIEKTHYIKKGESIHSIARKYDCTVQDIKAWNNRTSNYVKAGRKLIVYVPGSIPSGSSSSSSSSSKKSIPTYSEGEYIYYTIQKGDTLWDIANKHRGVSVDDLKRLNSHLNYNNLKTGTKIRIEKKG